MLTAVLLTGDGKLASQIELWFRQSLADRVRIETFSSLEAYKEMLDASADPAAKAGVAPAAAAAASGAKPDDKDAKKIKLFIVDADLIPQKPGAWVAELQKLTKEKAEFLVNEGVPKIMLMTYDLGQAKMDVYQQDVIDDLVLKPVDKTLFLQKIEFMVAEDGKVNPTFLFRAKTAQIVEVGRDVVIDEISEFAVAIRSPGAVPEGAFASIHADVFGGKGQRRIVGRVYESIKHPVREGEYLVRFSFFGISVDQLSTVRRFIRQNQTTVRVKTWGPPTGAAGATIQPITPQGGAAPAAAAGTAAGAAAPPKAGLPKELAEKMAMLKMRKFAIIDLNPETLEEAKSILEQSFKGIIVKAFPSYTRLAAELRKLLPEPAKPATAAAPTAQAAPAKAPGPQAGGDKSAVPLDQAFPGGKKLSIVLRGKSHEVVRFEPPPKKNDIVLGKIANEWVEKPDQWMGSIEKDDREAYEEFLSLVEAGTSGRLYCRMIDAAGRTVYLEVSGRLEKAGANDGTALVRVDMQELDTESFNKVAATTATATAKDPALFRFEAILIDGAFLRPDPTAWYDKFVELLRAGKVLGPDDPPPKIFVLSDPKARARIEDFRIKGVNDFAYKPIDRRFMIEKYKAFCPALVANREQEQPAFVPCEVPAKLGKEVTMDEVAEYGLSIIHPTAFREKTFMRFYSRLFGEDSDWVTGRCHGSVKIGDAESYRCQFMFFAPSDDLLQRIRRWIREDYVAKKDNKG